LRLRSTWTMMTGCAQQNERSCQQVLAWAGHWATDRRRKNHSPGSTTGMRTAIIVRRPLTEYRHELSSIGHALSLPPTDVSTCTCRTTTNVNQVPAQIVTAYASEV
jgi:hypothetical protein